MKISALDVLEGKAKRIVHGAVNSEITIELPGKIEIVSIITKSSARNHDGFVKSSSAALRFNFIVAAHL
jgi:molybdopterin-binding protein